MLRKFILKDTVTGSELVLPVTPTGYQVENGRKANSLDMYSVGQVNLPGEPVLLDETLECLLPARSYPFLSAGAGTDPWAYLERLTAWSNAGTVLRFVVSGTPVNEAVILGPIRYREQDGTNDVYCTIPLRGYRELAAQTYIQEATGNAARAVESGKTGESTYVVQAGDTLSGICRRFYGDAALYPKLAAVNGIANVSLISAGLVIRLPAMDGIKAVTATAESNGKVTTKAQETTQAAKTYKISVTFSGPSAYFGSGVITYSGSGKSGTNTVTDSAVSIVPEGAEAVVRWEARNGHSTDYRTVNGKRVTNDSRVAYLAAYRDHAIVIHWTR